MTKHLPKSLTTAKYYLDQASTNLQLAKYDIPSYDADIEHPQDPDNIYTHNMVYALFD